MVAREPKRSHWFYGPNEGLDQEGLNLVEFPFALLARASNGQKSITFKDKISDLKTGERLERSLTISANVETDLPNYFDQDVLVGLTTLAWRKNRFQDMVVEFTIYELLKLMKLQDQTRTYRRIAKSLDNWQGVRFKWSHWRVGDLWEHPKATVLIQDYDLTRRGRRAPDQPQIFTWSRLYFEAMQDKKRKPFDADFYFELGKPTQRRMYRYLEKRLWKRVSYQYPIKEFCVAKLGLADGRKPSQYPAKIDEGYDDLVDRGFLRKLSRDDRYTRAKDGTLMVNFKRGSGRKTVVSMPADVPEKKGKSCSSATVEQELIAGLQKRGIKNERPAQLVASFAEPHIREQMGNYDDRIAAGEKITPGWLIKAIESKDGYSFREGYVSEEEKKQRADQARLRAIQQEARKQTLRRQEEEKEKARRQKLNAHLESLSDPEQVSFFEEAKANNKMAVGMYQRALQEKRGDDARELRMLILLNHFESQRFTRSS